MGWEPSMHSQGEKAGKPPGALRQSTNSDHFKEPLGFIYSFLAQATQRRWPPRSPLLVGRGLVTPLSCVLTHDDYFHMPTFSMFRPGMFIIHPRWHMVVCRVSLCLDLRSSDPFKRLNNAIWRLTTRKSPPLPATAALVRELQVLHPELQRPLIQHRAWQTATNRYGDRKGWLTLVITLFTTACECVVS